MANEVTINAAPSKTSQTFVIQLEPRSPNWSDPAVYAPTMPGLIVALLGLWVSHKLSALRDQRKEILDLCDGARTAIDAAESSCRKAWLSNKSERHEAVAEAKSNLQALGIVATDLKRRTPCGVLRRLRYLFLDCITAIDVINDVARLRDIATSDPFDDANREPDHSCLQDISAQARLIDGKIKLQFHDLFG